MQVNRSRDGGMKLKLTKRERDDMARIASLCSDISRVLNDDRSDTAKAADKNLTMLLVSAEEPELTAVG